MITNRELLFPELYAGFKTADRQGQMEMERAIDITMGMQGASTVGNNNLGTASSTIWQTLAKPYIDASAQALDYLTDMTLDLRPDTFIPDAEGAPVTVNVEVVDGVGEALTNPTDFEQSDIDNGYTKVDVNLKARPFGLSQYDLLRGERIQPKLGAAINALVRGINADFYAALAAVAPSGTETVEPAEGKSGRVALTNGASDLTAEYAARKISPIFGTAGDVDLLGMSPMAYSNLIPINALDLGTGNGQYGIGAIRKLHHLAGAAGVQNVCHAVALRKNAVAVCGGNIDPNYYPEGCSVRPLGQVAGINLQLVTWGANKSRQIWCSVEAMIGFKVALPKWVYAFTTAAPTGSDSGSGSGSGTASV